jgi:hypothetical protein
MVLGGFAMATLGIGTLFLTSPLLVPTIGLESFNQMVRSLGNASFQAVENGANFGFSGLQRTLSGATMGNIPIPDNPRVTAPSPF